MNAEKRGHLYVGHMAGVLKTRRTKSHKTLFKLKQTQLVLSKITVLCIGLHKQGACHLVGFSGFFCCELPSHTWHQVERFGEQLVGY